MGLLKFVGDIATWVAKGLATAHYGRISLFVVTRILTGLVVCGGFCGGKAWAEEWVRRSAARGAPMRPSLSEGHGPTTAQKPWKLILGVLIISALVSLVFGHGLLSASDCWLDDWSLAETEEEPRTPAEPYADRFLKFFLILGIPAIFGVLLGHEHGLRDKSIPPT